MTIFQELDKAKENVKWLLEHEGVSTSAIQKSIEFTKDKS